jgi:hypothetical protein
MGGRFGLLGRETAAQRLWRRHRGVAGVVGDFFAGLLLIVVGTVFGVVASWMLGTALNAAYEFLWPWLDGDSTPAWLKVVGAVGFVFLVTSCFVGFSIALPISMLRAMQKMNFEDWARAHLGRGYRGRSDMCFSCGYDLSHGKSLRCPECGTRAVSRLAELKR